MFSGKLLLLTAVLGLAAAEVPSYIHVCSLKDSKLDECVVNSVIALREKLRQGIPELDIPPLEPLKINKIQLTDLPDFKAGATDIKLIGLLNYHINHLHVNRKEQHIDVDIAFDEIKLDALYNVSAKILVPIAGRGPISLVARNVSAKVKLNYKLVEHGGEKYIYFPSMTTHLDIKDYDVKFEAENFDKSLHEAITQALGNSHQEVLEATRPNLERAISETVLTMTNKICKHFTFDELFPDGE